MQQQRQRLRHAIPAQALDSAPEANARICGDQSQLPHEVVAGRRAVGVEGELDKHEACPTGDALADQPPRRAAAVGVERHAGVAVHAMYEFARLQQRRLGIQGLECLRSSRSKRKREVNEPFADMSGGVRPQLTFEAKSKLRGAANQDHASPRE